VAIARRYPQLPRTTFDRPSAEQGALKTFRTTHSRTAATSLEEISFDDELPVGARYVPALGDLARFG